MVFDFKKINQEYPVEGVIHVGAFAGEELNQYRMLGLANTMMFEPQEDLYNLIKSRCIFSEKIHNVALGSESCTKEMYISFREGGVSQGCGASSSLLKPKKHLEEHPEVTFPETRTVEVRTLDEYYDPQYNFLNIDVQGYELEVLKGNRAEVYEGCPLIEDIDNFLEDVGFVRVAEIWQSKSWGDALYAKR